MMLDIQGISFRYNSFPVLNNISFSTAEHEITAVLGPNGAGKTTLLRCMNRILKPSSGTVFIDGKDLSFKKNNDIAKITAYVAQKSDGARVTVFDSVLMGRKPYINWNITEKDIRLVQAALKKLGMEHLSLRYLDKLSGGEYQKACIARAVVQEPRVMLLDEPTSSLDLKNQPAIMRLLKDIIAAHPMCAIVSMHDLNTAFRYADNFIFLKNGKIAAAAGRENITKEIIESVYDVKVSLHWFDNHPVVIPSD